MMLCQKCKKNNASTIIYENISGQKYEVYLCSYCAGEIAVSGLLGIPDIENFFASVSRSENEKRCPFCGSDFSDITRTGKLGCHECYAFFEKDLSPTIQKIHGISQYLGDLPRSASIEAKKTRQINILNNKLQKAIANQEFEIAAQLRDEINAISS